MGPLIVGICCFWLASSRHCTSIRPKSYCTIVFYMDPITNDGSRFPCSYFARLAPLWGPTGEDLAFFRPSWKVAISR